MHNPFEYDRHGYLPETGSIPGNRDQLKNFLDLGESFDVLYQEDGDKITEREKRAEDLSTTEAVRHFTENNQEFDRFTLTRDHLNNPSSLILYEKKSNRLWGTVFPRRGDQLIFSYQE